MILEENMLIYYFMPNSNFIGFHKRYAYSLYIGNDKFACNRYKNEANRRVRVKRDSSYRVRIGLQKDFILDNLKFIVMRWFCDEGFDSKNSRKILKLTKMRNSYTMKKIILYSLLIKNTADLLIAN